MRLPLALLACFAVWAVCAWFDVAGQRQLFYEQGAEELYDFWMPRMCWEQGYAPAKTADYGLSPAQGGVRAPTHPLGDTIEFSDWYHSSPITSPSLTTTDCQLTTSPAPIFITGTLDKVYPALALLPIALFPATRLGGYAWSLTAAIVFLLACFICLRKAGEEGQDQRSRSTAEVANSTVHLHLSPSPILFLSVLACSMPFLFNLERGNPVWLSAAAVGVFLAWWDSPKRWQRYTAALCLAVAAVLKIAPAALGLLYVCDVCDAITRRRRRHEDTEKIVEMGTPHTPNATPIAEPSASPLAPQASNPSSPCLRASSSFVSAPQASPYPCSPRSPWLTHLPPIREIRVIRGSSFRCAIFAAIAAAILFFLPFLFVREGLSAIPMMIANAAHHADFVLRTSDFGFIQPWRAVRVALHLPVGSPWPGMYLVARLSQLFGLLALVLGARRRDYFLLVAGMLLAAGNMYYYGALYLLPVFLLEAARKVATPQLITSPLRHLFLNTYPLYFLFLFAILCPLQLILLGHSANAILCNLAVMAMMVLRIRPIRRCRH